MRKKIFFSIVFSCIGMPNMLCFWSEGTLSRVVEMPEDEPFINARPPQPDVIASGTNRRPQEDVYVEAQFIPARFFDRSGREVDRAGRPIDMMLSPTVRPPSESALSRRQREQKEREEKRRLAEEKRREAEDAARKALIQKIRADFEKRINEGDDEPIAFEKYSSMIADGSLNYLIAIPIGGGRYSFYKASNLINAWKQSGKNREPLTNREVDKIYIFRLKPSSQDPFPFDFEGEESAESVKNTSGKY